MFVKLISYGKLSYKMSLFREHRYLLLLTETYSALNILKNPRNYFQLSSTDDDHGQKKLWILFGSFPKDKEYTQVCCFNLIMMLLYNFISFYEDLQFH